MRIKGKTYINNIQLIEVAVNVLSLLLSSFFSRSSCFSCLFPSQEGI